MKRWNRCILTPLTPRQKRMAEAKVAEAAGWAEVSEAAGLAEVSEVAGLAKVSEAADLAEVSEAASLAVEEVAEAADRAVAVEE